MVINDATEVSYKNGYEKGFEDGKKEAVKHGKWIGTHTIVNCSECGKLSIATPYCFHCGAKMNGDWGDADE